MAGWGKTYEFMVPEWSAGVHASAHTDLTPPNSSPRALNCSFEQIGDGTAIIRKRRGMRPAHTTSFGQSLVGQHFYRKWGTAKYTDYHVCIGDRSVVGLLSPTFSTANTPQLAGPVYSFSALTAQNRMFFTTGSPLAVTSGVQGWGVTFDGTTWSLLGIARPDPFAVVTPTGTGDMDSTYEVAYSYKNSSTGHQSSRSTSTTVTLAGEQLFVQWLPSNDPQVDEVVIHLRNNNISETFYEAVTCSASASAISTTINISLDDYAALIDESPDEFSNEPCPAYPVGLAYFRDRLIIATADGLYYSERDDLESFDPERYEPVAPNDGQRIMAIAHVFDAILILKEKSVYALQGDGPNDWVVRQVAPDIGCAAGRSVVMNDDNVMWWSFEGPVIWNGQEPPVRVGVGKINDLVSQEALNYSAIANVAAVNDRKHHRFLFAVPELGQSRNSTIIPFNYQLMEFEGVWTTPNIASFCETVDTQNQPWVYIGSDNGQIYRFWDGDADGYYTGQYTGTFAGTTAAITAITGTDFDTTIGLTGLYLHAIDSSGALLPRRRISASSQTSITISSPWTTSTSQTYTWYVGAIDFQLDTKWIDDGRPFHKKRYEFQYLQAVVPQSVSVWIDRGYDLNETHVHSTSYTITPPRTASLWDVAVWDESYWSVTAPTQKRMRIAHTARTWRMRLRHLVPFSPFTLLKVGMRGEILTDKR